jgi:TolA-binding protein
MKKLFLVGLLSTCLFSCSLLQRRGGGPEEAEEAHPTAAQGESGEEPAGALFTPDGQEVAAQGQKKGDAADGEVSRLNTKVAALETKIDVLSANLERLQAQKSQPVIEATPQATLAAPVSESTTDADEVTAPKQVSAAPARPSRLPTIAKATSGEESASASPSSKATGAEKEFRAGMQLFQNGQNLEAASRFALMAKKFPHHMLAAHALYWAGESAARVQQWQIASENWAELEKRYPRSAYMPEALAGLGKAYEALGDATRANLYRAMLARSFPKSPVAMKEGTSSAPLAAAGATDTAPPQRRIISRSSAPQATAVPAGEEEPAPVFEEEGGTPASSGTGGEPPTETQ